MQQDTRISADVPDWSRERIDTFWEPGKKLIRAVRRYQHWRGRGTFGRLVSKYWVANHWFWSLMTQSELHLTTEIGGGLRLTHPTGIIIHPEAVIGPNGRVTDVKILRSVPLLDDAAVAAVQQWEYTPTLLNGVPVPVIMTVTVNFTLR